MIDFATRSYNHSFRLDPIVRSLLDTDFYKLLMLQFIWKRYKDVPVTFKVMNRSTKVNLADTVSFEELGAQLDYVRHLRFTPNELIWLQGNTFYGKRALFEPEFIQWLENFRLPSYTLRREGSQYVIEFSGTWAEVTLWEIYALSIINELRNRNALKELGKFELDILYARAKNKLWDKLQTLTQVDHLNLTDFGTRRRHSFLWQEWAVLAAADVLGHKFTGTSNAYLAMKHGFEAKGTNAHELPMVVAALAPDNEALKASQYEVCRQWQEVYSGGLLVALPDTFGTTQFLLDAPEFLNSWTGFRYDSKDPIAAGEESIAWWHSRNQDPREKLGLFSDGLDNTNIIQLAKHFEGRMRVGFGWGTLLTNDFRDCHPRGYNTLDPISLVCKVSKVGEQDAVKLSDNYTKATGPYDVVERYREVFGTKGVANAPVTV